jgi:Schlafen, AlbA_2
MVALRSARLEALLGSRLEQVQYSQLMTLISDKVPEAFDLDFKSEMYGSSDRDKRDAATDVAALANTAGGLLILGVEEDSQARASAAPGVVLSEADERRIRQIVGSQVVPMPVIDVLRIPDPARPRNGLVVIAVPRSPLAPHAVLVNEGLRYPKRNGATTRHLSEPEVAGAYRERFAGAYRQADRAREIEADALNRLATTDDQAWVVISLVPDLPGELVVDQTALSAARTELMGRSPLIMPTSPHWLRVSIGRRRLLADGTRDNSRQARYLSTDLHDDGAGVFAAFVLGSRPQGVVSSTGEPDPRRINDESAVNGILSGLRFLAHHARDRTAAGGNALIRAQLHPVGGQQPLVLGENRSGFGDMLGTRTMTDAVAPPERVVPLESLAADGPDLVSAAYLLASDVFQEFGWAEAAQLTRDGGVRLRYWNREWRSHIERWAATARIIVSEETLPG